MSDDDKKKQKKYNTHPFDSWPPAQKNAEDSEEEKKPRNTGYVDFYKELAQNQGGEVHGDETEEKQAEIKENEEKDEKEAEKDEDRDEHK